MISIDAAPHYNANSLKWKNALVLSGMEVIFGGYRHALYISLQLIHKGHDECGVFHR